MRVIDLTLKDLKQLVQDRRTVVFLLLMPIGFTLMFGFMFGGFSAGEEDLRLPVGLAKQDSSVAADRLVASLEGSEVVRLVADREASIEAQRQQVVDEELVGLLVIPDGYGGELLEGNRPQLSLIVSPEGLNGESIKQEVGVAASRLQSAALTAQLSAEAYERQQDFAGEETRHGYLVAAFEQALSAWEDPPIQSRIRKPNVSADDSEASLEYDNAFIHSSPGMMMMMAIAGLMGAADIIVTERKSRSLQRLLTTAISRPGILLGHYLAMFAMIFAQVLLLVSFGQVLLRLDYLQAPLATLLIMVTVAMCFASLGLLVGALAKSHEHVVVYSLIPMFVLAGIGGAWVPLEFTSDTVQMVGHFSPVAWGMDGFKNILARGLGLEGAWLPAGMLLLFTAVFFGLAVWRFKFE
jgi:ABC-2 type transport system permease protein